MSQASSSADRYRDAGVDIAAGNALVERIAASTASTARRGACGTIGGFGGLFDLGACGYHDPLLVAATDGVGTKVMLLAACGRHKVAGIDLVAMCVNDLVVQGADPLFFLDYYASSKLDVEAAAAVVDGVADGCRQAGCALIGGETAEMPGLYPQNEYDLAGFAIGAVERNALLPRTDVAVGDRVLGLAANGVHANGFSLVRRILETATVGLDDPAPFAAGSLADALLAPTHIYVRACQAAIATGGVKALAHITGGGLIENLPRVLPDGLAAHIDAQSWPLPPVFRWLVQAGDVGTDELARTFNAGIGMVVVTAAATSAEVMDALAEAGEQVFEIGIVAATDDGPKVRIDGRETWRADG